MNAFPLTSRGSWSRSAGSRRRSRSRTSRSGPRPSRWLRAEPAHLRVVEVVLSVGRRGRRGDVRERHLARLVVDVQVDDLPGPADARRSRPGWPRIGSRWKHVTDRHERRDRHIGRDGGEHRRLGGLETAVVTARMRRGRGGRDRRSQGDTRQRPCGRFMIPSPESSSCPGGQHRSDQVYPIRVGGARCEDPLGGPRDFARCSIRRSPEGRVRRVDRPSPRFTLCGNGVPTKRPRGIGAGRPSSRRWHPGPGEAGDGSRS